MELKDYHQKRTLLQSSHKKELALLDKEYALSNNKVQIGDRITDGRTTIEVEKIGVTSTFDSNAPECVYSGKNLTKAGTVNKRESHGTIYQSNLNN